MRLAPLAALLAFGSSNVAKADPQALAVNGAWTTLEDLNSQTKMCGIQIEANGGRFTVFGTSDQQGVLRIGLRKSSWHITGVAVPIVMKFADDVTFNFTGYGSGLTIRADVPTSLVRPFIHHLTADAEAILTLPEGHEAPWKMDLHGTTPASMALGQCADATQITLPPPFRAPQPLAAQTTPATVLTDAGAGPSTASTFSTSQPSTPDQAAAITSPPDNTPTYAATPQDAEPPTVAAQQYPPQDSGNATPPTEPSATVEPRSNNAGIGGVLAMGGVIVASLIAGAIALYFIPYIVGSSRKIENQFLLFVTNLLFGWTVFGWFGCLLWAALAQNGLDRALYRKMLRDGG